MHPDNHLFQIDVYGPRGIASLVLDFWRATQSHAECRVVFHELLDYGIVLESTLFYSNLCEDNRNRDYNVSVKAIYPDEDGYWTCFSVIITSIFIFIL